MTAVLTPETLRVCGIRDLEVERGRAALVGGLQIALFLLRDGTVHAVSNLDPFSGANVISRGIVGTRGDAPTVASPMHKQVFDLRTGACLDPQGQQTIDLLSWPVHLHGEDVHLELPLVPQPTSEGE